LTYTSISAKFI